MERWLSKSRVLLGLCAVLLMAALNRQDPMVYAMFLFLGVVSVLGFLLPWLSLRSTTVRLDGAADIEVMEGADCNLNILVERTAPWPAFMVDIETEWEWASQRIVLSQTVPVIRAGRAPDLGRLIQFPCRGRYELIAVRLSSGFPLGLVRARHTLSRPQIHLRVLPAAQPVQWPLPWDITEDPQGELTTRRMGQSFELGMLRPYQHGDSVGRVSWRASARVGELVIQHFQQSGSVRLRVAVEVPHGTSLGDATGAGEQAIRLAAGVCHAALNNSAQLFLYLEHQTEPVRDASAILPALAEAEPSGNGFFPVLARVTHATAPGEQVAVVVSSTCPGPELVLALGALAAQGCRVVVCIALGRRKVPLELAQAKALQKALQQAGFATLMEAP
jgi:uncharacterized protein (DUF58 family)